MESARALQQFHAMQTWRVGDTASKGLSKRQWLACRSFMLVSDCPYKLQSSLRSILALGTKALGVPSDSRLCSRSLISMETVWLEVSGCMMSHLVCSGILNSDEFRALIREQLRALSKPHQAQHVQLQAHKAATQLGHTGDAGGRLVTSLPASHVYLRQCLGSIRLNMQQFIRAVAKHNFRGTSKMLRLTKSPVRVVSIVFTVLWSCSLVTSCTGSGYIDSVLASKSRGT